MTLLTLELSDLSLATLRVAEPLLVPPELGPGEIHEPSQVSFPDKGFKLLLAGRPTDQYVAYIYIFTEDQTVDWLYRLKGKDHYGATFSPFRGQICSSGQDRTEAFWHNPRQVLSSCTSLQILRQEHKRETFVLKNDVEQRRIHIEFGDEQKLTRVILG